jgi:hypothetical protein
VSGRRPCEGAREAYPRLVPTCEGKRLQRECKRADGHIGVGCMKGSYFLRRDQPAEITPRKEAVCKEGQRNRGRG